MNNIGNFIHGKYEKGISCPSCFGKISKVKIKALTERNRQIEISKKKCAKT